MKVANAKLDVVLVADPQDLARATSELFINDALKSVGSRGACYAAISRCIPSAFFEILGSQPQSKGLPWHRIHLFWVDECCGSPDLRPSNYTKPDSTLISKIGIPGENVHRICSEHSNCEYVAAVYEQTIRQVVTLKKNGVPRFDVIMLAMGTDGHIASLFPDTYAFFETEDLVRVSYFMDSRRTRITLTNPVLCAALHIAVLVSGEAKAVIFRKVLTTAPDEVRYPVHTIWPVLDRVTWLVDRQAMGLLRPRPLRNGPVPKGLRSERFYPRL